MPSAAEWHQEQSAPATCVAACASIFLSRWGHAPAPTQQELLESWKEPKTDVSNLARLGYLGVWSPDGAVTLLRARLAAVWLIVTMRPGPLTHFANQHIPRPTSQHGRLVRYENPRFATDGLDHAVVLVGADADSFHYLDPWYRRDGQPFRLTDDELIEAWAGHVAIPSTP